MQDDNDNTASTSRTASPAANNDNTATNNDNTATTSTTASSATNNDNTATTSRTATSTAANNATTSITTSTVATTSRTAYNGYAYACAVCRYQRKRCTANCILARYFPPQSHQQFTNALRLFGVHRMIRTIKNLEPRMRDIAMGSIKWQSDVRAQDPVMGCYRFVQNLEAQIADQEDELSILRQRLAFYRTVFGQPMMPQPQQYHPGFQDQIPPFMLQNDMQEQQDENDDDERHIPDLNKEPK